MTSASRLFIAAFPEPSARAALVRLSVEMAEKFGGRAIAPENLHITLRFLGDTSPADAECLGQALDRIRTEPISLLLNQLEGRPRQRMVWIGCEQVPTAMPALATEIEKAVTGCGLPANNRDFLPHLTLVRKASSRRLSGEPPTLPGDPVEMVIARIDLVKSETLPEGSRYTSLQSWPLAAGQ